MGYEKRRPSYKSNHYRVYDKTFWIRSLNLNLLKWLFRIVLQPHLPKFAMRVSVEVDDCMLWTKNSEGLKLCGFGPKPIYILYF